MKTFVFIIASLFTVQAFSQNITIDYLSWNPATTPCNLFGNTLKVPATNDATTTTVPHQTINGQPTFSNADLSILLATSFTADSNQYKGTAFAIDYPFKAGRIYEIFITAAPNTSTRGYATGPFLQVDLINNHTTNTSCDGPGLLDPNAVKQTTSVQLSSTIFQEFAFNFSAKSAFASLSIAAIPAKDGGNKTIRINRVRIVESASTLSAK